MLSAWCGQEKVATLELIKAYLQLHQSLGKFKEIDCEELVPESPVLEALTRSAKQVEELKATCPLPTWQLEPWIGMVDEAKKLINDVSDHLKKGAEEKVKGVMEKAKKLAQSVGPGGPWHEGLTPISPWSAWVAKREATLGQQENGEEMASTEVALNEVILGHFLDSSKQICALPKRHACTKNLMTSLSMKSCLLRASSLSLPTLLECGST